MIQQLIALSFVFAATANTAIANSATMASPSSKKHSSSGVKPIFENCSWELALKIGQKEINQLAIDSGADHFSTSGSFANYAFTEVVQPFSYFTPSGDVLMGFVSVDLETCEVRSSNYG